MGPQFNNPDGVFDTPTLAEIWRTGPYLHDGRAVTIEEVFTQFNKDDRHGVTSHLTKQQIEDLSAYMLSVGTEEPVPPHPEPEAAHPDGQDVAGRTDFQVRRPELARVETRAASRTGATERAGAHGRRDDTATMTPRAYDKTEQTFLEASRRKFEEARLRAERLPGEIEPLLRAGRYEEAAEAARNAASPFAQIDAVELFFERWWFSAELMAAHERKVAGAIASGKLAGALRGRDPKTLCELARQVSDTNDNWDMLALGLLYLYRGRNGERAMECFRRAEHRGWDVSWFMARALDGHAPKELLTRVPISLDARAEAPLETILFVQAEVMTGDSRLQVSNHRRRHALTHYNKPAGWRIVSLSPPRPDGELTVLTPEFAGGMEPCLSFDAKKVLFVGCKTENDSWDVWEMDVDGSNKRKVIGDMGPYCCSPAYLSDGRISFSATRWASRMKPSPSIFPPDYGHQFTIFRDEYDGDFVRVLRASRCERSCLPWSRLARGRCFWSGRVPSRCRAGRQGPP